MNQPRILMIVTSNAVMGESGKPTGFWAEELAAPYYALRDAGAQITLASPAGGQAPVDPGSLKPKGQNDPVVERMLADDELQTALAHTAIASTVKGAAFDAVFFPGGHGTMWDLPGDPGVRSAVETAFAAGKIVAAVCHGPAGLVSAKRPDGASILEGKRVSAFTNEEEDAAGLTNAVPFLLESRVRELGARFEGAPAWTAFAVRDGQLVTGQNPQSSHKVADLVLQALAERVGSSRT